MEKIKKYEISIEKLEESIRKMKEFVLKNIEGVQKEEGGSSEYDLVVAKYSQQKWEAIQKSISTVETKELSLKIEKELLMQLYKTQNELSNNMRNKAHSMQEVNEFVKSMIA
jgi:hypothetical protein